MRKRLFFVACTVLLGIGLGFSKWNTEQDVSTQAKSEATPEHLNRVREQEPINKAELNHKIAKLHIPFITNQGQTDEEVKFYANTFGGTVFITREGEIIYSLPKVEDMKQVKRSVKEVVSPAPKSEIRNPKSLKRVALKEEVVGGKVKEVKVEGEAVTKVSYFKRNDPSKWKRDIPTYDLVSLGEVYEGVELKLKAYGDNVEKLFFVKPEGKPESIRLRLNGEKLTLNNKGELEVRTQLGTVNFTKPVAYQENGKEREFIEVAYVVNGDEYGFKIGRYDRTRELVIDPLLASTFLGGSNFERANSLAIDPDGNIYVTGVASSSDFPTTPDALGASCEINTEGFCNDVFISKLSGDLTTLIASTYLGGSGGEFFPYIAIDPDGNIYVTGETSSSDFPTTPDALDTSCGTDGNCNAMIEDEDDVTLFTDAFISKLSGDLTTLIASTYLGGSGGEFFPSMVLDLSGNIYVSGGTAFSSDFPTTAGVFSPSCTIDAEGFCDDAFISKLDGDLTTLLASTFLGGSSGDNANSTAIDSDGDVYVTGFTSSSNFPSTPGAFDTECGTDPSEECNDTYDTFISKLNGDLTTLIASTFLGGNDTEFARSFITLDPSGNVYVSGFTQSSDFPTTLGAFDISYNGREDAFVSKLSGDLTTLIASTFLGGNGNEFFASIAIDSGGNIYVSGGTVSSNFSTTPGAFDTSCGPEPFGECSDAFVSKLSGDLTTLIASTFLGGNDAETAEFIAVKSGGNIYVIGSTSSSNFPKTLNAFDTSLNSDSLSIDVFISKFDPNISAPILCNGFHATIIGTKNDDFLIGTDGPDVINGLDGNDTISGLRGNE
ncbi:MAG TPA: SBBP repeat-containing protein [Thermodesulfobacteriota bacterium]|nr:SBBP repeat-containing protein [Thermodesulfobacteriota bacterium]